MMPSHETPEQLAEYSKGSFAQRVKRFEAAVKAQQMPQNRATLGEILNQNEEQNIIKNKKLTEKARELRKQTNQRRLK